MKSLKKISFLQVVIVVLVFWIFDYVFHSIGVGETNYYYLSKFANAILFSIIWFFIFNYREHWKKIIYSFVFGTWVSFYYLISSYSGLVQLLGVSARYAPPPFVIGGIYLTPYLWWFFHALVFYIGLELAGFLRKK